MITFERTHEMEDVRKILADPRCYVRMGNDSRPPANEFKVADDGRFIAILAKDEGRTVAVFLLFPISASSAEVHFCFVPETWGNTLSTARAFVAWVWQSMGIDRLVGPVPSYNRLALELAELVGFQQVGTEECGLTKNGKPFHRVLTEIRRPNAVIR